MSEMRADNQSDADQTPRRRELVDYVSATEWAGPAVLAYCQRCSISDLEKFVACLKTGEGSIPLGFRWASEDDSGWFIGSS